jgi:7-carboxy-7-deazaguanine synthase
MNLRVLDYDKVLPVVELYPCVQSEGSRAGKPTICIRTTGCTHRCFFGSGGWCDTPYTSLEPEKGVFTFNDIIAMYAKFPEVKEMMLTGGSPTMHPALVNELTHFAEIHDILITIETEGSHFIETEFPIGLLSISPKFSNSVPVLGDIQPSGKPVTEALIKQHNKFRLNKEAISKMIEFHSDYHFKPVVNPIRNPEVWAEIVEFMNDLGIPKSKTWIMPPGDSRDELIKNLPDVIEFCTANSYNFSGRDHIIAFGPKRGV